MSDRLKEEFQMPRMIASALVAFTLLSAPSAFADDVGRAVVHEDWTCGTRIDPTPDVTAFFTPTYSFPQSEALPTFMAGTLRDPEGGMFSVLFVQISEGWNGYAVEGEGSFANAYASGSAGRAVLFSMIASEEPGHTYTVVSTSDGFKTVACAELSAPDTELGTLDYMRIKSLDLDDKGHGRLTGIVGFTDEKRHAECFQAKTEDGGRHWTQPKRSEPCVDSIVEAIMPVPAETGPLHDLRMFSGN